MRRLGVILDGERFDAVVAKGATAGRSRRGALRVAGAAIGVLAGLVGVGQAGACAKLGQRCDRKKGAGCCGGAKCHARRCRCRPAGRCGQACCRAGDRCADPTTETCVTGRGTCAIGADSCGGSTDISCNPDSPGTCACFQTAEGETFCGDPFLAPICLDCTTDADCIAAGRPLGTRCVAATGRCAFCANQGFSGMCLQPCEKRS